MTDCTCGPPTWRDDTCPYTIAWRAYQKAATVSRLPLGTLNFAEYFAADDASPYTLSGLRPYFTDARGERHYW